MNLLLSNHQEVWCDTTLFCRLAEADLLAVLQPFLGERCRWVHEVAEEVKWRSRRADIASHHRLSALIGQQYPKPPKGTTLSVSARETAVHLRDLLVAHERLRNPDAEIRDRDHLGESATVAHVAGREGAIAVLDDGGGQKIADFRGVSWVTSRRFAAEMVVLGGVAESFGRRLFDAVQLPANHGPASDKAWDAELDLVRGLATTTRA